MKAKVFRWAASARLEKSLSMFLIVAIGAAMADVPVSPQVIILFLWFVGAAAWTNRLNVWSDRTLDSVSKPELLDRFKAASSNPGDLLLEGLLLAAVSVCCSMLLPASSSIAMICAIGLGTLYSYNVFSPSRAEASRWKTHWLGHASVFVGAYWMLGLAGAGLSGRWQTETAVTLLLVSLSGYSLLLAECGLDAEDERTAGLVTMASLFGWRGSSLLGLGMAVGTVLASAALPIRAGAQYAVAIGAMLTLPTMVPAALGAGEQSVSFRRHFETIVDITFLLSRSATYLTLLVYEPA